jgi:hypothetical protein
VRVLCIHGIGHQKATAGVWQPLWTQAIASGLHTADPGGAEPTVEFFEYDDEFEAPLARWSYADFARALWNLTRGALQRPRGLLDFSDSTRWHAGMVAVWVNDDDLREQLRDQLRQTLQESNPDLICAHSLGSLIAYDLLSREPELIRGKTLLTFGSQIGNIFVRGSAFAGRVEPLPTATEWFHLYNSYDHVFTAPLDFGAFQTAENFKQVLTQFGTFFDFAGNHDAVSTSQPPNPDDAYLTHPQTRAVVWPLVSGGPAVRALAIPTQAAHDLAAQATPTRRALLVGINTYLDVAQRLEGCVNNVFLISSVLQECGFEAEDIRVVLDDRATADAVRERLHWLLDGVKAADTRFFFYSGHGAQLPVYGPEGKIDQVAPCLVPYDFNWTDETALTGRALINFYSQLPFDSRFMMFLDCCYAGGMTRGGTRARGLDPPDDIRQRMLRWDAERQMWVARDLSPLNRDLLKRREAKQYVGDTGATLRLGRAVPLRLVPDKVYDRTRKDLDQTRPYLPIVYEACGEKKFAYEYQHGPIGHRPLTYAKAAVLRRRRAAAS